MIITIMKIIFLVFFIYPFKLIFMFVSWLLKLNWSQMLASNATKRGIQKAAREENKRNWYMPDRNTFDNDIEQFSRADGR